MNDSDEDLGRRNVSTTCGDIFLEKLIEEVKKYPCIYAVHSLQYRDVAAKERCWNEIAKHSDRHSSGLKKEWKKLRDCYRQALVTRTRNDSKKKNLRPWKFEKQMEFLKSYITPRSQTPPRRKPNIQRKRYRTKLQLDKAGAKVRRRQSRLDSSP